MVDSVFTSQRSGPRTEARRRRRACPGRSSSSTRHELALEMLKGCGRRLPHGWVAGDDEMGRPAIPPGIGRPGRAVPAGGAVEHAGPRPGGTAAGVLGAGAASQESVHASGRMVCGAARGRLGAVEVRDGEKGPLVVEAVKCRVQARTETGGDGPGGVAVHHAGTSSGWHVQARLLAVERVRRACRCEELARVAKAEHRIEECFRRAKGEAGLGDYQVRNWPGWHHHQTLSLLAAWFLTQETRRGKNPDPGADVAADAAADRGADRAQHWASTRSRGSAAGAPGGSAATSRLASIIIVHVTSCHD